MDYALLAIFGFVDIDWNALLLGTEKWNFLIEVALRSLIMFLAILISLRILGKRSVAQLSVFELGMIIGLGSAAGDPMFYKDVGVLPGMTVFVVIVSFYRFMTFLINKSEKIENFLEGEPVYLVESGVLNCKNFQSEPIAHEEFFTQLRLRGVSHLGQLHFAIIETNGSISPFFYSDEDVKWGLPVLPHLYAKKSNRFIKAGHYACTFCGQIVEIVSYEHPQICSACGKDEFVAALKAPRIS